MGHRNCLVSHKSNNILMRYYWEVALNLMTLPNQALPLQIFETGSVHQSGER